MQQRGSVNICFGTSTKLTPAAFGTAPLATCERLCSRGKIWLDIEDAAHTDLEGVGTYEGSNHGSTPEGARVC